MTLTVGSLFSGVGGFDLGFERAGMKVLWQCEKDPAARSVLRRHWPDVTCYEDVRDVGAHNLEHVDVICGGFPCQDLSIAGKRAGLTGERSGLWFEFARIVREMQPEWVVIENVPGLLSSNGGKDIGIILSSLEQYGYAVDCDILDTQNFGVPQRRRRVFLVCQHVGHLAQKKTTSSAQTIAQCLTEILHSILVVARHRSLIGYMTSTCESKHSVDGMRKRMRLFGLAQESRLQNWRESLDAEKARFPPESSILASVPGGSSQAISLPEAAISFVNTCGATAGQCDAWNTVPSWKNILDDISCLTSRFITSTETSWITESTIYTCAKALLSIAAFTCLSSTSSPTYWSLESSVLTAIREYMSYARQASGSLLTGLEWIQLWIDFLPQAQRAIDALNHSRTGRAAEVLFEREGSAGDYAEVDHQAERNADYPPDEPAWWNGRGISQTLDAVLYKKQAMPEKNRFPAVIVPAWTECPDCGDFWCNLHGMHAYDCPCPPVDDWAEQNLSPYFPSVLRFITPIEAERLQGFPDGWTDGQSDSARYRQMGNAITVNVAEWIGRRIVAADCSMTVLHDLAAAADDWEAR